MKDTLYSPKQVAQMLHLKYGQIMRRIKTGKLKAEKVGWGWAISKENLELYKKDYIK